MKKIVMTAIVVTMLLSVTTLAQPNLIVNGDFEAGNTGFTTDYYYSPPASMYDPKTYTVGTNPGDYHTAWDDYGDNTSGSGNMLIVNATYPTLDPVPYSDVVWQQTVSVTTNTDYVFSYWIALAYSTNPPLLQCLINDIEIGQYDAVGATLGSVGWTQVSYNWNSGGNTSATIKFIDQRPVYSGDDYTIDDISLYAVTATIEKEMTDEGELGDHITITLTVDNPYGEAVTVEDVLPDGLAYIPDIDDVEPGDNNLKIDDVYVTPTIDGNKISVEVEPGEHEIVFVVQVVSVECEEVLVTNVANVYNPEGGLDDSAEADITLYPYAGFSKEIATCTEPDPYYVPMYTDVHWLLRIEIENIAGDEILTMEDVIVKDNLGGDLEMHLCYSGCPDYNGKQLIQPPSPTPEVDKTSGKTDKLHLSWELSDLSDESLTRLFLEVSTDINPGHGKKAVPQNEYTSEGPHDLNSGATVKFIDPATGLQLSAHTCPITVEAYIPMLP